MNRNVVKCVVWCGLAMGAALSGWGCGKEIDGDRSVAASADQPSASKAGAVAPASNQPGAAKHGEGRTADAGKTQLQSARSAQAGSAAKQEASTSPQSASPDQQGKHESAAVKPAGVEAAKPDLARGAAETAQPGGGDTVRFAAGEKLTLGSAQRNWPKFFEDAATSYKFTEAQRKDGQRVLESCLARAALPEKQPAEAAAGAKTADDASDNLKKLDDELIGRIDGLASVQQIQEAAAKGFKSPKYQEAPIPPDVGRPAPEFELKDGAGKPVKLASLRGKVVVLQFWATWCGFCKKAMPDIQKLQDTFKDDPSVVIYGINCAQRPGNPAPAEALKEKNCTYGLLVEGDAVAAMYDVHGYPNLFIVGPDGKIVHKESGAQADQAARLTPIIQKAAGRPVTSQPVAAAQPATPK